jgi:hypothetical protein
VPGLPGGVASNHAHDAEGLAVHMSRVVLDEEILAVVAGEVDVLDVM